MSYELSWKACVHNCLRIGRAPQKTWASMDGGSLDVAQQVRACPCLVGLHGGSPKAGCLHDPETRGGEGVWRVLPFVRNDEGYDDLVTSREIHLPCREASRWTQ